MTNPRITWRASLPQNNALMQTHFCIIIRFTAAYAPEDISIIRHISMGICDLRCDRNYRILYIE